MDGQTELESRKTAALAQDSARYAPTTRVITGFAAARELLRSGKVVQGGAGADAIERSNPEEISLFYLDGEVHRRRRSAIAKYFSVRTIETRYTEVMQHSADALLQRIAAQGGGNLDDVAFHFAVAVASEILGLDYTDLQALSGRIKATINSPDAKLPTRDREDPTLKEFYRLDVQPAIEARRTNRREDVISRLLDDGSSDTFIKTEVRGYSLAGMITTREFIVMAAWYMFEQPALKDRFLAGDNDAKSSILAEILRLEPVVGVLKRRVVQDIDTPLCGHIPAGTTIAIDIRATNMDEAAAGACPYAVNPGRAGTIAATDGHMSFGDGMHRCPGAMLSLYEARIFLTRLLALPGVAMAAAPRLEWFRPIASYVLSDAAITCDRPG